MNREDIRKARSDLPTFAALVGRPLRPYQADALTLDARTTVLVAPRQTGKSYSLAVLSLWSAFRRGNQRVLIVSAGEEASKRLLAEINATATHPLLKESVLHEAASLLMLSNGSEIRSVPASERQIRGWSVDLLIVDEAALVADDVLLGAALPTTAARPEARIILASTPWAMEGAFYRSYLAGLDEANQHTRAVAWKLADAPWITPEAIEHYRATLPPLRFQAEFEGQFVGASDALFPPADLKAAVCSYQLLEPRQARGEEVVVGVDWGRAFDRHAVAVVGVLDDYGANEHPILFVPWLDTSQRPYSEMVEVVASLPRPRQRRVLVVDPFYSRPIRDKLPGGLTLHENGSTVRRGNAAQVSGYSVRTLVTEMNGVGAMPSEELRRRLGHPVVGIHSSQRSKEDAFSRLRALLSDRRIVLPDQLELLRQLQGLTYAPTASGGLTIEAGDPNVHDDLADALSLAVSAVPHDTKGGAPSEDPPDGIEWLETSGGVRVPAAPRPRKRGAFRRGSQQMVTW